MINNFLRFISQILFLLAFIAAGFAVWEKLANFIGFTVIRGYYSQWQLIELATIALIFVIAIELREIKLKLKDK